MDSTSPYAPAEYFEFPNYDNYNTATPDSGIVSVESLHNSDNRYTFGSLNTLQLSAGQPYYPPSTAPPSYLHAVRSGNALLPSAHIISGANSNGSSDHEESRELSPMNSISPPMTSMSASDLSGADSSVSMSLPPYQTTVPTPPSMTMTMGRPGTSSPPTQSSLVHRRALRNSAQLQTSPLSSSTRAKRTATRRSTGSSASRDAGMDDDFSDDDEFGSSTNNATGEVAVSKRREEVRKQRIESEQRRRDELRDGYRRLKDVLPVSNQKSSKVSLLDRATTHIRQLEMTQTHMIMKINELEAETARLRTVTETLMLNKAAQAAAARQMQQQGLQQQVQAQAQVSF